MSWSAAYTTFSLGESRAAMSDSSVCGGLASSGRAVAKTAATTSRDLQMLFMLIPFILLVDEARLEILNKKGFCQPRLGFGLQGGDRILRIFDHGCLGVLQQRLDRGDHAFIAEDRKGAAGVAHDRRVCVF